MNGTSEQHAGSVRRQTGSVANWTMLAIAVLGYLWLGWQVKDGLYLPSVTDEFGYYAGARVFAETGRLHGVLLCGESVARVGEFGGHGGAYAVLHGLVGRVFGNHPMNIIITNAVLLLLALALVGLLLGDVPLDSRLTVIVTVLLYLLVPVTLFSYMQEILHVFIAAALGTLLYRASRESLPRARTRWLVGYAGVVVVATLFRPSWAIAMLGLIPLAAGWRQLMAFTGLSVAAMLAAFGYSALFLAPFPYGFLPHAMGVLGSGKLLSFFGLVAGNFGTNVGRYFASPAPFNVPPGADNAAVFSAQINLAYAAAKYLLFTLTVTCIVVGFMRRDRLALGVGLVALVTFGLLFTAYDAFDWREQRTLGPLIVLLAIAMIPHRRVATVVAVILLALFPQVVSFTQNVVIARHRAVATKYRDSPGYVEQCRGIGNMLHDRKLTTVLVTRRLWPDGDISFLSFPTTNAEGFPLRYTYNMVGEDLALHKPGFVDYVLTVEPGQGAPGAEPRLALYRVQDR